MSEKSNLQIVSKGGSYSIQIHNSDKSKLTVPQGSYIIYDSNISLDELIEQDDNHFLIPINANEQSKDFNSLGLEIEALARFGATRSSNFLAIGGGCIQDIATFIFSIYMRGVPWTYFPTTLASMMDSCIGGKSSINLGKRKNLLGNFFPPSRIEIFLCFVNTLPLAEIACGISEGGKICYAYDRNSFREFSEHISNWRTEVAPHFLERAILLSLTRKKFFVEIDEFDKNERQLLNFGHSFAHALESATLFVIPHGIAVLIGMLAALEYTSETFQDLELFTFIQKEFNLANLNYGRVIIDLLVLEEALRRDKKNSSEYQVLILPNIEGSLEKVKIPLNDANIALAREALLRALTKLEIKFEVL